MSSLMLATDREVLWMDVESDDNEIHACYNCSVHRTVTDVDKLDRDY